MEGIRKKKWVVVMTETVDWDNATVSLATRPGTGRYPPRVAKFDTYEDAEKWVNRGEVRV